MKNKIIVCPFLCLLLLLGCSKNSTVEHPNPKQEIGENTQTIHYGSNYVESIQYPKTDVDALDKVIQQTIKNKKKDFLKRVEPFEEERKAEFNVTYESYLKDKRYISVVLFFYDTIYEEKEHIKTFVYDKKKETFLSFEDIYDKEELATLSALVTSYFRERFPQECDQDTFRTHTSAIVTNFVNFALTKAKLTIYFAKGTLFEEEATFSIGYEEIADATSMKNETAQVVVPYGDILNEPVKNIDPKKPMVALTFDDGPTRRYTTAILDALKENNASATFFVLGSRAKNAPDVLQRMILEGSEIGNHSYSHKQLTTLSKENIKEEISEAQESIYNITHRYPKIIRPPYGSKNDTLLQCANGKKIVTWTLDTSDWRTKDAKTIVEYVMDKVKNNDIILMHDLYASSAQAAVILIPKLKEAGYQLVTVSELYAYQ